MKQVKFIHQSSKLRQLWSNFTSNPPRRTSDSITPFHRSPPLAASFLPRSFLPRSFVPDIPTATKISDRSPAHPSSAALWTISRTCWAEHLVCVRGCEVGTFVRYSRNLVCILQEEKTVFESAAGQRYSCDHAAATLDGGQIMLAPIVSLSLSLFLPASKF